MQNEKDFLTILRNVWGYEDFRGIQREVIDSIASGRDTLALMPTGGGKSITFQVPALAMEGLCIVVTPLVSLMRDQVAALRRKGIKAAYIDAALSHEAMLTVLDNAIFGAYKFLYVSPERLSDKLFLNKLSRMDICFLTVDEAHCICQWGYDFRPSYLDISGIREYFEGRPVLALTATATPAVVEDIQRQLHFREPNVLRMSFERKNLAYIVQREASKQDAMLHALESIPGSCIIYTRSRRRTEELAAELNELGFQATYYHAGLSSVKKNEHQERWRRGEKRIMVATNAFGMGIDKPDVRLVLHVDIPDSIEAYFQEAGRAGRDGNMAQAILLTDGKERQVAARRLMQQFPDPDYVAGVYELLCCYFSIAVGDGLNVTRELDTDNFCRTYGYFPATLFGALDLLDKARYISYQDKDDISSRLRIDVPRDVLFSQLDTDSRQLLLAVLRRYGGIFVDYAYIDEQQLSFDTGLTTDDIYQILKRLDQQKFVSFIHRKHLPRVTFVQRRVDRNEVSLPAAVYGDRRCHYVERMEHMLRYADAGSDHCRSRMLLKYFGEDMDRDCGICDVCTRRKEQEAAQPSDPLSVLRRHILRQLQAGPRYSYELDLMGCEQETIEEVIDKMRSDGEISTDGLLLRLAAEKR